MPQSITSWSSGIFKNHTDSSIFSNNQDYVAADSIVLAVRPLTVANNIVKYMKDTSTANAVAYDPTDIGSPMDYVAIGVIQNVNISQQRPATQLWELGSKFSYFVPGRNMIQASISKVILNGSSLLKNFYPAYNDDSTINDNLSGLGANDSLGFIGKPGGKFPTVVNGKAGESYFYTNLASELFNNPIDMMLMMLDSEGQPVHGMVLKQSYVQAHQMNVTAQQMVIVENAIVRAVRIIPVGTL